MNILEEYQGQKQQRIEKKKTSSQLKYTVNINSIDMYLYVL